MIVVVVTVDEPGNPEAGTRDEDVITGIFHGFEDDADAMKWIEAMQVKWKIKDDGKTKFTITESRAATSTL